jgi:hypothetical protein
MNPGFTVYGRLGLIPFRPFDVVDPISTGFCYERSSLRRLDHFQGHQDPWLAVQPDIKDLPVIPANAWPSSWRPIRADQGMYLVCALRPAAGRKHLIWNFHRQVMPNGVSSTSAYGLRFGHPIWHHFLNGEYSLSLMLDCS